MKHLKTHKLLGKIGSKNKEEWAYIFVEEYATIWSISARIIGYALNTAEDWRYSKKQYKTVGEAVIAFEEEYRNRN